MVVLRSVVRGLSESAITTRMSDSVAPRGCIDAGGSTAGEADMAGVRAREGAGLLSDASLAQPIARLLLDAEGPVMPLLPMEFRICIIRSGLCTAIGLEAIMATPAGDRSAMLTFALAGSVRGPLGLYVLSDTTLLLLDSRAVGSRVRKSCRFGAGDRVLAISTDAGGSAIVNSCCVAETPNIAPLLSPSAKRDVRRRMTVTGIP